MKAVLTLMLELDIDVDVQYNDDDDGCPGPSVTGNSMTGRRGTKRISEVTLEMTDAELAAAVRKQINRINLVDECEDQGVPNDEE